MLVFFYKIKQCVRDAWNREGLLSVSNIAKYIYLLKSLSLNPYINNCKCKGECSFSRSFVTISCHNLSIDIRNLEQDVCIKLLNYRFQKLYIDVKVWNGDTYIKIILSKSMFCDKTMSLSAAAFICSCARTVSVIRAKCRKCIYYPSDGYGDMLSSDFIAKLYKFVLF